MTSLTDRVSLLESMLKEKGTEPPPVVYPPKTTRGTLYAEGDSPPPPQSRPQMHANHPNAPDPKAPGHASPASIADEAIDGSHGGSSASVEGQHDGHERDENHGTPIDDKKEGLVSRLLSTRGHLSFDQLSGRLRYYGPTTNCHIYSELDIDDAKSARDNHEQARRAERIIRTLPLETHDDLMSLFWTHYNGVLHVVHEEAFNEDRENGRTQFYSGFLHICILAMAYRFADKSRADMQRIALPDRESTLHREAKYMLDLELERPGGIPSVAALLILGDSEVGVGRDNAGWMYSGMAMRLCFDLGLHLDSRQSGMSPREVDIRRMTLWACYIYDRYWALFLGRPTSMKSADLEIYSLANQFERLGTLKPAGPEKSLNTRIYEALIDLMEIAGKITENTEHRKHADAIESPDQSAYFRMAALDRELHMWMARLPQDLRYTEENRASAPLSFYLLHQQYHAILIMLHRPFARYDDPSTETEEVSALDSHFSRASRAICTKSAVTVARIFWQHRQRFDTKQIFCIGMQHAGCAATALVAGLAYIPDAADRNNNMQYLEVLAAALQDMSHGYQPAERMAAVLSAVMVELRGDAADPGRSLASQRSTIPARRGSTTVENVDRPVVKRRATARTSKPKTTGTGSKSQQPRPSDAGTGASTVTQRPPNPPSNTQVNDFVMITPRTETSGGWPNLNHEQSIDASNIGSMPQQNEVDMEFDFTTSSDFPSLQGLSSLPDTDMNQIDFLALPSEDDWHRWHSGARDAAADLDGFPPRGRLNPAGTTNGLTSPPMGGIMNG